MDLTIETKDAEALPARPLSETYEEFMRTFDAFKEENDARLASLEAGRRPDTLVEEKIARIEDGLDDTARVLRRLSQEREGDRDELAHKAAFTSYVRKGDVTKLTELERKAMSVGSEADGGYLVPDETERRIMSMLKDDSPIRALAGHVSISTAAYKRPFVTSGAAAGWVGEAAVRPDLRP